MAIEEIVLLYRAGIPLKEIMRKFGLKSNSVIYRHVQPNRLARLSVVDRSRIKALYFRGEKIDYIAHVLGISRGAIYHYVAPNRLPKRIRKSLALHP